MTDGWGASTAIFESQLGFLRALLAAGDGFGTACDLFVSYTSPCQRRVFYRGSVLESAK